MFDYVSYQVTEKYQELTAEAVNGKLGIVKTFLMEKLIGGTKKHLQNRIDAYTSDRCVPTYYYHSTGTACLFTHLFLHSHNPGCYLVG